MSRFFPSSAYVEAMVGVFNLTLTPIQFQDYCAAVEMVQSAGEKPVDLLRLHETLCASEATAGQYRESSVVALRGVKMVARPYPRGTAVRQLVFSFRQAYKRALRGEIPEEVLDIDAFAWQVAATGRCIRPFSVGNTRLFTLIENHIRQAHGLPWRIDFRDKEKFTTFRRLYMIRHAEFYGETTGAP